jgi:hypothetical protein
MRGRIIAIVNGLSKLRSSVWGTKYVVVPFTSLKIIDKKMVLPGGTKDALKALPDFKYAS